MHSFAIISLVILSVCEVPILNAKKVVVVMPRREIRRSPPSPIRHLMMQAKKHRFIESGGYHGHKSLHQSPQLYSPKNLHFMKNQFPSGGDDFDHGHEEVNNVRVPHGRGITHAVSFGKGYIPFESFNDPRLAHPKFNFESIATQSHQRYAPVASIINLAQIRQSKIADSYAGNVDDESKERAQHAEKYANLRAEIADASGKSTVQVNPSGIVEASPTRKQPIVLTDTIILGDYHRKLAELAKSWPAAFSNPNYVQSDAASNQPIQSSLSRQFDGNNALSGLLGAVQSQGYAVKEEVVDAPHDFRSMPIQATAQIPHQQAQQILPQNIPQVLQYQQQSPQQIVQQQSPQPSHQFQIIQQPVQQALQHVLHQAQVPLNIAIPNYQPVLG